MTNIYCIDNLELLKSQPTESLDLIYCDILYGTGRNFGDYQDLKPIRSEIEAHYLPRLKEMHRVLKSTGSIYLQMDTRINHWMRILMDDVFAYSNFRNEIVWCYSNAGKSKNKFSQKHDVILFYSKNAKYNFNYKLPIPDKYLESHYNQTDDDGNKCRVRIDSGKKRVYYPNDGVYCNDWFTDIPSLNSISNERTTYNTQKPKALIERLIKASSNEGDTVADYYLGSGTTAVVCKELNRNFIGCDINPKAIEITNHRLSNIINKL